MDQASALQDLSTTVTCYQKYTAHLCQSGQNKTGGVINLFCWKKWVKWV